MPVDNAGTTLSFSTPDRRSLIATLCQQLNAVLTTGEPWEQGSVLRLWQVTTPSFEALPGRLIEAVLDEWRESSNRLDAIEFSGYLDTDSGHRAWGFVAVRAGQPLRQGRPAIDRIEVRQAERACHFSARIEREPTPGSSHE